MASITELETLRRKITEAKNNIGSAYDYLDRGRPDEDQIRKTRQSIERLKKQEQKLMKDYLGAVHQTRKQSPRTLEKWANIHIAVYREIMKESQKNRTLIYIAEQTIAEWEAFLRGECDYVKETGYLMDREQQRFVAAFKHYRISSKQ